MSTRKDPQEPLGWLHETQQGGGVTVVHWPPAGDGDWTCDTCGATLPKRRPARQTDAA